MRYDALIFDLDGTLWDSNESCVKGWNSVLEKLDYKDRITVQGMDSITGKSVDECIDILLPGIKKKHNIERAVYIGDTDYDKESAELSGSDFIQLTYGFGAPIKNVTCFNNFNALHLHLLKM